MEIEISEENPRIFPMEHEENQKHVLKEMDFFQGSTCSKEVHTKHGDGDGDDEQIDVCNLYN